MIVITSSNFKEKIEMADKPVVLDVYASWCGPCIQMMPIMEQLNQEYGSSYIFAKLNVEEARDIAILYGVTSVPTFIFIKDNQVKGRDVGFINKEQFIEKMNSYFA